MNALEWELRMILDVLIEKAKAARPSTITRDTSGNETANGPWKFDASLSPEVVIALCEVAKAAKSMTWARGHRNDSWRTYKRVREALGELERVCSL